MQLKPGSVVKYGIPYRGSKTKLIEKIARFFPNADHFYDLFGGGFSVTHYMLMHRRKSFKHFHFNEIRPGICELIQDAIAGKYSYDNFKPPWISRDEFEVKKDSCAYTKIIWSFGNNGKDYIFGQEIENQKRSMHQAIVFDEFDDFMKTRFNLSEWPNSLTITGKRLFLKKLTRTRIDLQQLERLQQLEQLAKPIFTSLDYRAVEIMPKSVIYCDIPYKNTGGYGREFDHNEFFDWADAQVNPVFISEYLIDDKRFRGLKEFSHRTTFAANSNTGPVTERLYCNKAVLPFFTK